jgi:hypothetical protein
MVFACPPLCSCLNACARSAPLANPLTRSGVSRTIIRPQTLALCRPPFRSVRAFRLRVPGAAQPGGRNVLRPSRHGSCRARNRVVKTGLRPRRPQTPGPAAPVPLRLHSHTPLHSRRTTASACSSVRLLTSSTNQCQRGETASLDSAPAEPGAHRVPPTRPASINLAHRSGLATAHLIRRKALMRRATTPLNDPTPPARSQVHSPPRRMVREKNAGDLREPRHPQCQARRGRSPSHVPRRGLFLAQQLRGFRV